MQISDLTTLSTQEKLRAMETLWDALCHENSDAVPSPAWHARALSDRHAAWASGETKTA